MFAQMQFHSLAQALIVLESLEGDERFDLAEGIYWYCSEYHGGQGSEEYAALSSLGFEPGPLATAEAMSDGALETYTRLVTLYTGPAPALPEYPIEPSAVLLDSLGYSRGEAQYFTFGAVGITALLYFSDSDDLSAGLETCAEWLRSNGMLGYFSEPEYPLADDGTCSVCGSDQSGKMCEHFTDAEVDHTYTEAGWILGWEWHAITVDLSSALRYALERGPFGAMVPEVYGPDVIFWEVDGDHTLYPGSLFSRSDVADLEDVDLEDVSLSSGVHGRFTMPGCLDSTDWVCYSDWDQCAIDLLENA